MALPLIAGLTLISLAAVGAASVIWELDTMQVRKILKWLGIFILILAVVYYAAERWF